MADRIVDLSESAARLRVRYDQLIIEREKASAASLPLADLAVLVIAHPQVSCSQAVLAGLAEKGGAVVVCNGRRLPVAMMLPLAGHFIQTERVGRQAAAKGPVKKRLWQQIVRAKIASQADLLEERRGKDFGLRALLPLVRSGDPGNVEARAASRYWDNLFGAIGFRRVRDAHDQNALLNYGYAVLRAITARAIVAAGLHPSLGLHHHNRYDTYCLADDVMEPFRVLVDRVVAVEFSQTSDEYELVPEVKRKLLAALTGRCELGGEARTLFDVLTRTAKSLVDVFEGTASQLALPRRVFDAAA